MGFDLISSGKKMLGSVGRMAGNQNGDSLLGTVGNVAKGVFRPTGEPQKAYMWEVVFLDGFSSRITYYASDVALPSHTQSQITRYVQNKPVKYPGKDNSPNTCRITFWDDQDLTSYRFFVEWYRDMNTALEGRRKRPEGYKRSIRLNLKDTSDFLIDEAVTLSGCFPVEISPAQMSYSSSEVFTFDVDIAFDTKQLGNGGI